MDGVFKRSQKIGGVFFTLIMEELFRLKEEGVKIRLILDSWEEKIWSKNEEIKSL